MPIFLSVAVIASLTVAHAQSSAPPAPEQGAPTDSDQPPVMTAGQRRARDLWASLSEADKTFVRDFIEKNHIAVLAPQMLALRARGKNNEALKILAKNYGLDDPVRAEIVLKLLAYAHDQQ